VNGTALGRVLNRIVEEVCQNLIDTDWIAYDGSAT
jgi:hypothetical protein